MNFELTAGQEQFRREVGDFLAASCTPHEWDYWDLGPGEQREHRAMALKLGAKGWLSLTWPKQYGGLGRSRLEAVLLQEQLAYYGNPGINRAAVALIAPALLNFGTEAQKAQHLPGIASGRTFWSQGFSEPGAGSDLAAVSTRAVRDGSDYVINGQKIWTSFANKAEWIFVLARTGEPASRHKGLSYFLTPLDAPGIRVRPIRHMAGFQPFCEVFFDDVRVPEAQRLGAENEGWAVAMGTLSDERSGVEYSGASRRILHDLQAYCTAINWTSRSERDGVANRLARLATEVDAARLMAYRVTYMQAAGDDVSGQAAMSKVFGSELMGRLAAVAMQLVGNHGPLVPAERWAPLEGRLRREYMAVLGRITAAGSSEIMRNIIATRGLRLPVAAR